MLFNGLDLHYYDAAGNTFVLIDNRDKILNQLKGDLAWQLCSAFEAEGLAKSDGLILLEHSDRADFKMLYYNNDGSGGMMCGNGARAITAFAKYLGVFKAYTTCFEAPDGLHKAEISSYISDNKANDTYFISVSMNSFSQEILLRKNEYFLNTGTRHLVQFVKDMSSVDILDMAVRLRNSPKYAPEGTNVNFVLERHSNVSYEILDKDNIKINLSLSMLTYEKGVEAVTASCGTGVVASTLAFAAKNISEDLEQYSNYEVEASVKTLNLEQKEHGFSLSFSSCLDEHKSLTVRDLVLASYVSKIL